jgi:hypothetical protein
VPSAPPPLLKSYFQEAKKKPRIPQNADALGGHIQSETVKKKREECKIPLATGEQQECVSGQPKRESSFSFFALFEILASIRGKKMNFSDKMRYKYRKCSI